MGVRVKVTHVPPWVSHERLLGAGDWTSDDGVWTAALDRPIAADLAARLRGIGLGYGRIDVQVTPALKRNLVRAARTEDARRRRDTTPGFVRSGCRLDEEGKFSLTPDDLAKRMAAGAKGRTVVDACCGAGGNTIGFARAGCDVVAIEQSQNRLDLARHNAQIYGVSQRINFRIGDATKLLGDVQADILFVDPPWGVDYDKAHCTLQGLPLLERLLVSHRDRFSEVWIKAPPSFDPRVFEDATTTAWFGTAPGDYRRVKFSLVKIGA